MNNMNAMNMSRMMAEDVHAPELRNPNYSGMRRVSLIARLAARIANIVRG